MENQRKVLLPSIIAVATLVALVAGATYAYFAVGVSQSGFTTRTIRAEAADPGTVVIQSGSELRLAVSAPDMMNQESDVTYYAVAKTNENQSVVPTHSAANTPVSPTIATLSTTSSNTFNCTVNFTISYANNDHGMIDALVGMTSPEPTTGQLLLKINNQATAYDLYTQFSNNVTSFNHTVNVTGITTGNPVDITAQLALVNIHGNDGNSIANSQNDLAGTSLTLNIALAAQNPISCTAVNS